MLKHYFSIVLYTVVLVACTHHHAAHEEELQEHHHHDIPLSFTVYSDSYELYAEVAPLSVDKDAEVVTYITRLSDFKPLQDASVQVSVTINNKETFPVVGEWEKPGIFAFQVQPKCTGSATITYFITKNDTVDTLIMSGLEIFNDEHEAEHEAEEHHVESTTAITFLKEASWQVDFATDYPQMLPMGTVIPTTAQVQHVLGDEVTVVAKANGTAAIDNLQLLEGSATGQGTTLLYIHADGFLDDNFAMKLAIAKSNYETSKQNYERIESLKDSKIVSEQEWIEKKNTYENARLVYENLQRNSQGDKVAVQAPISGFIKQLLVANGDYVTVGQPLMVISKNKNLMLKAEVPARYASVLCALSGCNIEDPQSHQVHSLQELGGRILSYGKSISQENWLLPVAMEIHNVGCFTSGEFLKVWLTTTPTDISLVIPKTALIEEQGNYYVFEQLTPERFEKKYVTIGCTDGKYVQVLSGITQNQRIVTRGSIFVKLAKTSGNLDPHAGHIH